MSSGQLRSARKSSHSTADPPLRQLGHAAYRISPTALLFGSHLYPAGSAVTGVVFESVVDVGVCRRRLGTVVGDRTGSSILRPRSVAKHNLWLRHIIDDTIINP